jgi:hypothetical protein
VGFAGSRNNTYVAAGLQTNDYLVHGEKANENIDLSWSYKSVFFTVAFSL